MARVRDVIGLINKESFCLMHQMSSSLVPLGSC